MYEYVYYWENGRVALAQISAYRSREEVVADLTRRGLALATKKDYDDASYARVYKDMKESFESGNAGRMIGFLRWNENRLCRKAFGELTGVRLSPTMKVRLQQLRDYFGEKFTAWEQQQREQAEERARKLREEIEAEHRQQLARVKDAWDAGESVNNDGFLLLCDHHAVTLHPRTRGFINKCVMGVHHDGRHYLVKGSKTSAGFGAAFHELKRKMSA